MLADSATQLGPEARGRIVLCGSHGGEYSAACAVAAGVAGIVLNDAAVGLDEAGIAGLSLLEEHGIPGATVGYESARIGDARQTAAGTLTHVNGSAAVLGVRAGMRAGVFVECVLRARTRWVSHATSPNVKESRSLLHEGRLPVWAIDSASIAGPEDSGAVVVTGSHAQLVGGDHAAALRADARLAVFNDAGGVVAPSRLDALHERGIAAVAVAAASARIGDGRSSYFDGVISAVNQTAAAEGAAVATTVRAYVSNVLGRNMEEAMG